MGPAHFHCATLLPKTAWKSFPCLVHPAQNLPRQWYEKCRRFFQISCVKGCFSFKMYTPFSYWPRCNRWRLRPPKIFWLNLLLTAVYLTNRSYIWKDAKLDVSNLQIFRCIAFAYNEAINKLEDRINKCIMTGYTKTGYKLGPGEKWDYSHGR